MRPIFRGKRPIDSAGNSQVFTKYQEARGHLIDRLGEYCSYCEMPLKASLAVEHCQPKSQHPKLELEWDNFLLACTNCNSTKGDKDVSLADYYWVHIDNTFRAFIYLEGGLIRCHPSLTDEEKIKAEATIKLVGLDKISINDRERSDRRQSNRRETWDIAKRSRGRLQTNNTPEMREQIVDLAKAKGFWSIWMTVFKDDRDMLQRFIAEFPGTCQDCFDQLGNPIPRAGGNL
jgi:uncharacterized protein (TIGR02646 family)